MEIASPRIFLQKKSDTKKSKPLIYSKITGWNLLRKLVFISIRAHPKLRHLQNWNLWHSLSILFGFGALPKQDRQFCCHVTCWKVFSRYHYGTFGNLVCVILKHSIKLIDYYYPKIYWYLFAYTSVCQCHVLRNLKYLKKRVIIVHLSWIHIHNIHFICSFL